MNPEQVRREDLRKAVRGYLSDRMGTALKATSIQRGVSIEWDSNQKEINNALYYLMHTEPAQVGAVPDSDGATLHYRITAEGVRAHERNL